MSNLCTLFLNMVWHCSGFQDSATILQLVKNGFGSEALLWHFSAKRAEQFRSQIWLSLPSFYTHWDMVCRESHCLTRNTYVHNLTATAFAVYTAFIYIHTCQSIFCSIADFQASKWLKQFLNSDCRFVNFIHFMFTVINASC